MQMFGVRVIEASLSEPHLGPYSGCGVGQKCVRMYVLYILPIVHTQSLRGDQFKVQRSVEAESACDVTARTEKRGQSGNARGIVEHLIWLNICRVCGLAG